MKLSMRLILLTVLLGGALSAQWALRSHLEAAGPLPVQPPNSELKQLPTTLGQWKGQDREIDDPKLLYADQHLQRSYVHTPSGQTALVWMAFSREGVDRRHHPEVCMAVAGQPEDTSGRNELRFEDGASIQQYRFGRPGAFQWVFYWYYTLRPPAQESLTDAQRAYQKLKQRPASVTIEVFAPEFNEQMLEEVQEFVRQVDRQAAQLIGPHGVRGSRRVKVTRVEDH